MRNKHILIVLSVIVAMAPLTVVVFAGNPDNPPWPPETTFSYTLEHIYDRLTTGAAGTKINFTEPTSGPTTGTGYTLDEIMNVAPQVDDTNGAAPADVLSGKTYWGLSRSEWAAQTGTMPNNGGVTLMPTTTQQTIVEGYHNGSGYIAGDTDLVAGNIKSSVNLFGVNGTLTSANIYNAGVPKSGQTNSFAPGDDGDLQMGVVWPNPRFITSTTGTVGVTVIVTDTLTGLVWLQDANCIASQYPNFDTDDINGDGRVTWLHALDFTAGITVTGVYSNCAAGYSDWRLPNVRELNSLIHYGVYDPALPNTTGTGKWSQGNPFTSVQSDYYWSSTDHRPTGSIVWRVNLYGGRVYYDNNVLGTNYVWPVRGGQ